MSKEVVFFENRPASIKFIQQKPLSRLVVAVGNDFFAIPGNQILRAIELVSCLSENQFTSQSIGELWRKKMIRGPIGSNLTPNQVCYLCEALMEIGIHPSIDEIREYLIEQNEPDQTLAKYFEELLRIGISNRIRAIQEEIGKKRRKEGEALAIFKKILL